VIHLRNGKYGLVEIKLGGDKLIEEGAKNLLKLKDHIDTDKMKEPSFMMIITALGDYAYRRKDGILIVPIGCLKN
ncbi:MAG: AAA family ATPase, partial [Sphaerochaetaceae bacterium]|nr:AAA family ATPase [Sphaerochaetaceae bacterium]